MGSFKEISKKRTKSHSDNQLKNGVLFEKSLTAISNINELPHGKSRKLSHEETSPSSSLNFFLPEDKIHSPLPSFNLNLDSASYLIDDCCVNSQSSEDEITANKNVNHVTEVSFNNMFELEQSSVSCSLLKIAAAKPDLENVESLQTHSTGYCQEFNSTDENCNSYLVSSSDITVRNSDVKLKSQFTELKDIKSQLTGDEIELKNKNSPQPEQKNESEKDPCSRIPIDQSYETNTDLTEYSKCSKNPGHAAFHAVDELQVKNLPLEIQHEDSLTFFNCAAQLVVQISVFFTSPARGPNDMYSQYIGTSIKRNGSGFIASVDTEILKFRCKQNACPLECYSDHVKVKPTQFTRSYSSPDDIGNKGHDRHYFYSGVTIHTNKHVIFDKSEADRAIVKFFFNSPDQTKVVYGHVTAIVGVNKSQDHVTLHVMSHDRNLFYNISCLLKDAKSSYNQMVRSTHRSQQTHGLTHSQSWVAVIGHAHGLSKAITFGHIRKEEVDGERIVKYYDAATCPGSSGGLVMTPSLLKLQWPGAVHSACDIDSGLNVTLDSRVHDLDYQVIGQIYEKRLTRSNSESSFPSIE